MNHAKEDDLIAICDPVAIENSQLILASFNERAVNDFYQDLIQMHDLNRANIFN